ncbi:molybdopterin-dependent oxidoreductase, partial [Streptomyces sp. ZEA17I]|uniref:molybdopterin-dependent oxidoreductase n=1 Tax=Streptomyces sp. ZEA17I TaxID=2202516 RepID=UPI00215A4A8C
GRARSAGIDRRDLLRFVAAASAAVPLASVAAPAQAAAPAPAAGLPGVVKPLPPELFTLRGTNAETDFAALRDTGLLTPADRFFVRNHTATPEIDRATWKLTVWGDGLTGGPVDFTYADLLRLPSATRTAFVECAGNGRSFFTSQQGQAVSGTAWTLGAIGTARWRGVRLGDVLRRAGIGRHREERQHDRRTAQQERPVDAEADQQ